MTEVLVTCMDTNEVENYCAKFFRLMHSNYCVEVTMKRWK